MMWQRRWAVSYTHLAVFRKGHIVTKEDIPVLLSVGKENLFVWEKQEGMLHENDAAEILRQVCPVSYTHLDVYKRQLKGSLNLGKRFRILRLQIILKSAELRYVRRCSFWKRRNW